METQGQSFANRTACAALVGLVFWATAAMTAEAAAPVGLGDLPRVPHEAAPDAVLYPDYFAAALPLASASPDARFATPGWHAAGAVPSLIVLPVQSQAWAVSAWARALVGARLDVAIARRGVNAGRQTDVVDADGPFVRRLDEATIAAFVAAHPSTAVLVPYVGRDADGQAFVTLQQRAAGRINVAHERVAMPDSLLPAVDAMSAALERELATLQVGRADAESPAPERDGCNADDWRLADAVAGPVARACRALVVGSLMPHLAPLMSPSGALLQPDRLAWLASAWAQAQALAPRAPALREVAALAAWELRLDGAAAPAPSTEHDPVVRALARITQARALAAHAPQRSTGDAAEKISDEATAGLPLFAAALGRARARLDDRFATVDFCGLAVFRPQAAASVGCSAAPGAVVPSAADAALLGAWRVAAAVKAILVDALARGDAPGVETVLRTLPSDLAGHPLVKEARLRALVAVPLAAGRDEFVARTQVIASLVMSLLATTQRDDPLLRNLDLDIASFERVGATPDDTLLRYADNRARLQSVLSEDEFGDSPEPRRIAPGTPATFLAPGRFLDAQAALAPALAAPASRPQATDWRTIGAVPSQGVFANNLARTPNDSATRAGAALAALKHGATMAEATATIDGRMVDQRSDHAIGESHAWAVAPNVFFLDGEMLASRRWFERVVAFDTYSSSDLDARTRLRLIDGDLSGALSAAREALSRYPGEGPVRDVAGLLIAQGHDDEAWSLLLPRLQTALGGPQWVAALAGLRRSGVEAAAMPAWLDAHALGRNLLRREPVALALVVEASLLDRAGGAQALQSLEKTRPALLGASALQALLQSAIAGGEGADVDHLLANLAAAPVADATLWRPFLYAAAWQASGGKAPLLDDVRGRDVDDNFEGLLAAAMVAALDGHSEHAHRLQHAARFEISVPFSYRGRVDDDWQTAPYRFVLAGWLMAHRTGDRTFLDEPLQVARDYEKVKPYWAWPLAFDALAGNGDGRERLLCRARTLDANSMFLALADPRPRAGVCVR